MKVIPIALAICALLVGCLFAFPRLRAHVSSAAVDSTPQVRLASASDNPATSGERVRPAAVAGGFYPADRGELARTVDDALAAAGSSKPEGPIVGIIVPHAGYAYSARVAAHAYAALKGQTFDTVVMLGPCHRARVSGAALSSYDAWETPLGRVSVDRDLVRALQAADPVFQVNDDVHSGEHSLEVQLPFLQRTLTGFSIVPIAVWDFSEENCAAIAAGLVKVVQARKAAKPDARVLLLASSDMAHYPAYDQANATDRKTLDLISRWKLHDLLAWEDEAPASGVPELYCTLCGLGPVVIVMDVARQLGANTAQVLKYANSGDVPAGDKTRCVGYGAVVLCNVPGKPTPGDQNLRPTSAEEGGNVKVKTSEGELNAEQQQYLVELARRTIREYVTTGRKVKPDRRDGLLGEKRAVFVTLEKEGRLRGCIGDLVAHEPLVDAVVSKAIAAATEDPRFPPVSVGELNSLRLHVSVLSPTRKISSPDEIILGKHGVIVSQGLRKGVFLPEVAIQQGWDRDTMLRYLCAEKAGLPPDAWKHGATLEVFTTQQFGDE